MSALRIFSDSNFGIFSIFIISKIIFFASGAFTTAPVVCWADPFIFLGYSIIVRTTYFGLFTGNILIKDVKSLSLYYPPFSLIKVDVPVLPPIS